MSTTPAAVAAGPLFTFPPLADASWASEFFVFFAVTFVSAALGW